AASAARTGSPRLPTGPPIRRRVPACTFRRACSRRTRVHRARLEKTTAQGPANVATPSTRGGVTMLKQLTQAQVWVRDQDEALAFYTDKLGFEVREDVTVPEMGNFRWLTVGIPGQDVAITLMAVP